MDKVTVHDCITKLQKNAQKYQSWKVPTSSYSKELREVLQAFLTSGPAGDGALFAAVLVVLGDDLD